MRVCIEKLTGKLIESQSGGDENDPQYLQALITNAINAGYNETDIEAKYITDEEFDTMMKSTPEYLAMIARQQAKMQAFIDNLPSWAVVGGKFDTMLAAATAATNLAQAKAVLIELIKVQKKMARVLYWQIKDSEE